MQNKPDSHPISKQQKPHSPVQSSPISRRDLVHGSALAATGLAVGSILTAADTASGEPAPQDAAAKKEPAQKRDWWDKEFRTLVTIGESTTAGAWASSNERCWASRLAEQISQFQRAPVQLRNVGIGSNVISTRSPCYHASVPPACNERIDKHVVAFKPDLLVIAYGFNDARGGTPLDLFCQEMKSVIAQVRKHIQPLIVLPGPYYMSSFTAGSPALWHQADLELFHKFNDGIAGVARETDCLFVDLLSVYGNADWLIHFDKIHANDVGHQLVANKMFEILASNCSGIARETRANERQIPHWLEDYRWFSS